MAEAREKILFEKFEIIKCLKKDDYTCVYLAQHVYLDKAIILKTLNTQQLKDKVVLKRFKREAKILAKLNHPNIIKVLDFGTYQNHFYISFEHFNSSNLKKYIEQNRLTIGQKKSILLQLAKGSSFAHKHKIVHRDIKPENILINQQLEVKIADFGLSLILDETSLTNKQSIVGTPSYMSPEQIQGGTLSAQSDLFSLGIVGYELFLGENPYVGADLNTTLNNILQGNTSKIAAGTAELPASIRKVLQSLLQNDQELRFKSAQQIIELLEDAPAETKVSSDAAGRDKRKSSKIFWLLPVTFGVILISAWLIFQYMPIAPEKIQPVNQPEEQRLSIGADSSAISTLPVEHPQDSTTKVDQPPPKPAPSLDLEITKIALADKPEKASQIPGKLLVYCSPWADVYVDSLKIDTTPMEDAIRIFPGRHQLKLVHPNYPPYWQKIHVLSESTATVSVDLDTLFCYLTCHIYPWGEIYVDEKHYGQTPLSAPIILYPGTHLLMIEHPKYRPVQERIHIKRRDTLNFQLNLERVVGAEKDK